MAIANAAQNRKSVADPTAAYESMQSLWDRSRAVISGERFVKDYDGYLDTINFQNLLIPFSPSMTPQQYAFYRAEAELPGIVSQYSKTLIGGLLRKQPQLKLPEEVPDGAYDWVMTAFSQNNLPLVSFLDEVLDEELQTSRAWVYVDYPKVNEELTREEQLALKPYPVLWNAESIINWRTSTNAQNGQKQLEMVIIRNYEEVQGDNEFHREYRDTVWVHELKEGKYQIRKFQKQTADAQMLVVSGKTQQKYQQTASGTDPKLSEYKEIETIAIEFQGEPLSFIPAWPVNGNVEVIEPMLTPFIDKEVALYNKISRRNHLVYGAATYTPVIAGDLTDDQFSEIVDGGLGTWIRLPAGATADVLKTPTDAIQDMDRGIAAAIEEMARLGIRMLTAETAQSGVALDIRNAAQTAQLGTLNTKISNQFASIIAFMLNWRYDLELSSSDIGFELSADFNPTPLGADWLRLATEWYEKGLIPRSIWLEVLKQNDMISPDYDDDEGKTEINSDELIADKTEQADYTKRVAAMAGSDANA